MLDIGWSEMAMIALLALIVIGPKDLPKVMRSIGQWTRKARSVAREFQSGLDDMMRESELDEARKTVERTRNFKVGDEIEREVDPDGSVRKEAGELDRSARGDDSADSGGATTVARETPTAPGHSVDAGKSQQKTSGTGAAKSSGGSKASGAKPGSGKSGAAKSGGSTSGGAKSGSAKSSGTKAGGTKSAASKSSSAGSAGKSATTGGGSTATSGSGAGGAKSGGSKSGTSKSGGSKGTSKSPGNKGSTSKTSGSKATS